MDRTVGIGKGTRLLAPQCGGQYDICEGSRLGEVAITHHQKERLLAEDLANPAELGQRYCGVGAGDPQEVERTLFDLAEGQHRMSWLGPVRNDNRVNIPQ